MAKCYLMLEDLPQDEEGEMGMAWAVQWGTEDGLQPTGDAPMTDAQRTMSMLIAAIENGVNQAQEPEEEPSRILIPH